jgi:hypothetical protein
MRFMALLLLFSILASGAVAQTAVGRQLRKPTVRIAHAYGIDDWSAVMVGSINPNGLDTHWHFQLGTTKAYGLLLADVSQERPFDGSRRVKVEEAVECLAPATTYHFRIVAKSKAWKTYGPDQTFTTKRQQGSEAGVYDECPGGKALS